MFYFILVKFSIKCEEKKKGVVHRKYNWIYHGDICQAPLLSFKGMDSFRYSSFRTKNMYTFVTVNDILL